MRFGKKGKLAPRYIGPFPIIKHVGKVAYKLELPESMNNIHPTFHISLLRKYIPDESHILKDESVQVDQRLMYEEKSVRSLIGKYKSYDQKRCRQSKLFGRGMDKKKQLGN